MKNQIKLVITAALKKELPIDWLASKHIPVHTLASLTSGILARGGDLHKGIMVIVTGAGIAASGEAAGWIRDNLNPLFVLNIGSCGLINHGCAPGKWLRPQRVSNESGSCIEIDPRLPVPLPEDTIHVDSLISVRNAKRGNLPASWKKHEAIDMECYAQAVVFKNTGISFHCLKFGTDYSDTNTIEDFNVNLDLFAENARKLFKFIELSEKPIRITAIVPVYNRRNTIARAIDSILSQTYMPREVLVVDDCSTDGTGDILQEYGEQITRITLPENAGPSRARNKGIQHARTDWIAFIDSDDCWKKDKLKKQAEYVRKNPFYQILQSEEMWIRNNVRVNPCKHHRKPEGWIWRRSLERCLVSPSGVMARKSLLESYGCFAESLPVCEDYDLWLKISRNHPVGLERSLSVIKYGGHADQLSAKYPAMDRFRVRSLLRLLDSESHPEFRKALMNVLSEKLNILIKGYQKRGKTGEADEYREILSFINSQHIDGLCNEKERNPVSHFI